MNIVILKGNLTRDVELRDAGKSKVAEFGLATNRKIKRADGSKDQEVTYVDCEIWAGAAEVLAKYAKKGTPLLLEGSLKYEDWEGSDGKKRSKLSVRVNNFEFLGGNKVSRPDDEESSSGDGDAETPAAADATPGSKIPF